jgi:hypothetical protein
VASSAAANQAAAARAAAPPATPPTVNVQVTAPAPAAQWSGPQKLEQLKSLLTEGLITQAQYDKASQQIVNELVK